MNKAVLDLEKKISLGNTVVTLMMALQLLTACISFYILTEYLQAVNNASTVYVIDVAAVIESFKAIQYASPALAVYSTACIMYLLRKAIWTSVRVYFFFHSLVLVFNVFFFGYYIADIYANTRPVTGICRHYMYDGACRIFYDNGFILAFFSGLMFLWGLGAMITGAYVATWGLKKNSVRETNMDLGVRMIASP